VETLIHTWDRFYSAVMTLALGDHPARERLLEAVTYQLNAILLAPEIEGISEDLQERIQHLYKTLTQKGTYKETILEMDQVQVVQVVNDIVSLFHDVSIALERSKD
jgi:hypothetical protein